MGTDPKSVDRRLLLQNALTALDKMQAKLKAVEQAKHEPLAIIGMSCRFPGGANNPELYWDLLHNGKNVVTKVPPDRTDLHNFVTANSGKQQTAWYGGFLEQVDLFDPQFFGIAPREAESMDPQQRFVLEVSWEALERAGQAPDKLKGSQTGIFVGITTNDYSQMAKSVDPDQLDVYTATGSALNAVPGRVAYTLGLQGPSVAIDTACSSSLVAVHLACQSLRTGESNMALAGGVNVTLSPEAFVCFSKWGMMAPDGICKTFDAKANGFVRGEGCGMLVLKRLSDAQADGDNIIALIRGSAVNQDGRSSGLTVPNGLAQQAVIQSALANSGVSPAQVNYVEAHGTGTSLGDPIEIEAISAALKQGRSEQNPLIIGSVKTNIGHLESASGIAGLMKVCLSMQNREIPPHLHLQERSPDIPWPKFPIIIPKEATGWHTENGTRIAGVSSFGFSGTNAHTILEEAPPEDSSVSAQKQPYHILNLSTKSEAGLKELANSFESHFETYPNQPLERVSHTVNLGRAHFDHRLAVVASSSQQIKDKLAAWSAGEEPAGVVNHHIKNVSRAKIAFLFTGQGSQYVGMGQHLFKAHPVFRVAVEQCAQIVDPYLETPLLQVLYPEANQNPNSLSLSLLDNTAYTQPALFSLEYALAKLWMSWGVEPNIVMGHSVGEYVAACIAGVFSLEDGLKLITARAQLMQALPGGGKMAAVFAHPEQITPVIAEFKDQVSIAAVNGPANIVISGAGPAITKIVERLKTAGIKAKYLTVSHAFHSPLMNPVLNQFTRATASISYNSPKINLVSNLSGQLVGQEIATPDYWQKHIQMPVQFAASMKTLKKHGVGLFLEIGPKPTLLSMGQRCLPDAAGGWLPSLRQGKNDWESMLQSLAHLHVRGVNINWNNFYNNATYRPVVLPTYPFQRKRYWLKAAESGQVPQKKEQVIHPLLHEQVRSPLLKETVFQAQLGINYPAYLNHHRLYGTPIFPGTGYLELALAAAKQLFGPGPYVAAEVVIQEAMILPDSPHQERTLQVAVSPVKDSEAIFKIYSLDNTTEEIWVLHAQGKIVQASQPDILPDQVSLQALHTRYPEQIPTDTYYAKLAKFGIEYGPSFRGINKIWREDGHAFGQISLPQEFSAEADQYQIHPALLDACFQLFGTAMTSDSDEEKIYVPIGLESLKIYQSGTSRVWCHVNLGTPSNSPDTETVTGNLQLLDDTGHSIADITGLHIKQISRDSLKLKTTKQFDDWLYKLDWQIKEPSLQKINNQEPGTWLVFADKNQVGAALAAQLREKGERCVMVQPGQFYQQSKDGNVQINPAQVEDFHQLLADTIQDENSPLRGIIHLWSLDTSTETTNSTLLNHQLLTCGSILHLIQALETRRNISDLDIEKARLWLLTQGANALETDITPIALAQTAVWGLGKTIILENPSLHCTCLDMDPMDTDVNRDIIVKEFLNPDEENLIALRHNTRYVARLVQQKTQPRQKTSNHQSFELKISTPGILDNLALQPVENKKPEVGEVEVDIAATGLNFRDVLFAMGMYPGPAIPLGNECAGTIVATGKDVTDFSVGDEVIALAAGTFKSSVVVPAERVFAKPANLTFTEAVTIPTTFLTAYYGLHHLAKIKPTDRVLIHAAAGGVGMAAVFLAQQAGAEVLATAGSPQKRAYLKSMGINHVFNSRTLDFAHEVMEATDGKGVNITLNSLADDFISKSLSTLSNGGCFLELGKRDNWDQVKVAALNPTFTYHRYDLALVMQETPKLIQSLLHQLLTDFEKGLLKPLPVQTFSMEKVVDAFRYMAQAKHIGKIVVTQPDKKQQLPAALKLKEKGTYLITGGVGGLGLEMARWLVEHHVSQLVLMGRSEPGETAKNKIEALSQQGTQIITIKGDVTNPADIIKALSQIDQTMPPLKGIIHAAGVLQDGLLRQQSWSKFTTVMAPKIDGAWHLHTLTRHLPLDFFILFSAGAALLGSPGQGNYAAANAFLDGLAHHRRRQCLPALSINWGAWAEVGMAASPGREAQQRWTEQGFGLITPNEGTQILEQLITQNFTQVGVLPFNLSTLARQIPEGKEQPLLQQLLQTARSNTKIKESATKPKILQQLEAIPPGEQQYELLLAYVQEEVIKVLGLDPDQQPNPGHGLTEIGMDSLMAVELSNRLQKGLQQTLPSTIAFEYPTIIALTNYLSDQLLALTRKATTEATDQKMDNRQEEILAELEELSDDEAEDSLLKELENAGY